MSTEGGIDALSSSMAKMNVDDDEDIVDDWEALDEGMASGEEMLPKTTSLPSSSRTKAGTGDTARQMDEEDEVLADPVAEKKRLQKLVEDGDRRIMEDLFDGCELTEKPIEAASSKTLRKAPAKAAVMRDPMDLIEMKSLKDVETLAAKLSLKIQSSPAKSVVWLRFLDLLLKECARKMELKDLQTVSKKLGEIMKKQDFAKREATLSKKKPNDPGTQMRNFKDEMNMFYGDMSDKEESDEDEGFYDDFM